MSFNSSDPSNDWGFVINGDKVTFEALDRITAARIKAGRPNEITVSFQELLEISASQSRRPVFGRGNVGEALRYAAGNGSAETLRNVAASMDKNVIKAAMGNLGL